MPRRLPHLILPVLLLLGVTACNDDGAASSNASGSSNTQQESTDDLEAGDIVIEVRDDHFAPDATEVAIGETVTWDFATADSPHDVTFDDQHGSTILEEGTWSTTFDEPGSYPNECTLHPGMTGLITVTG
ncbi:MAG: cupredoxin domain-containing protein [Nitriliruptoraceae bacterium]